LRKLLLPDKSDKPIILAFRLTAEQRMALQKAWERTGEYSTRTEWIKKAINSFAEEEIFQ